MRVNGTIDFARLDVGDELPTLHLEPAYIDLVVYAGTSRDYFVIHHDRDAARAVGLPDVIVQGSLKAAWLARVVTGPLEDQGKLREFGVQYRGIDVPNRPVSAHAVVRSTSSHAGERLIEVDLWLENEAGQQTVQGSAVVCLPSRHDLGG